MSILVKICGVTNSEDAQIVADAGADAIGFNFSAESPRYVTPKQAAKIVPILPSNIVTVGLFVNSTLKEISDTISVTGIKAVQFHGDESADYVARFINCFPSIRREKSNWPAITKAFRLREEDDLEQIKSYTAAEAFVIDAYVSGIRGGTGQPADWTLAIKAKKFGYIILAGGLNPSNIRQAIDTVAPFAVDVSSGVEKTPGKKDAEKVQEFIQQVRKL